MQPTLQQIFLAGYEAFERIHPFPGYVRRVARSIINCRTPMMGGHIETCPEGHFERIFFHSCCHRVCPKCVYIQIEQWLVNKKELSSPARITIPYSPCLIVSMRYCNFPLV
ncbi:MAG: transposase zinc-binding domain-containing protein [bacterium]